MVWKAWMGDVGGMVEDGDEDGDGAVRQQWMRTHVRMSSSPLMPRKSYSMTSLQQGRLRSEAGVVVVVGEVEDVVAEAERLEVVDRHGW